MLASMAWRNLGRNLRRTVLTGVAVATAVILPGWLVGFTYGAYDQMIDKAVHARIGHLQVHREGYVDQPEPRLVVPDAEAMVRRIASVPGVQGVSARVVSEGLLARDNMLVPVELVGVDPEAEATVSVVPSSIFSGEKGVSWCRARMTRAKAIFGGGEGLFTRWCEAAAEGAFLPSEEPRAVVVGRGVAERLLVNVGDELTVQVVRAVDGDEGAEAGALSQRRLLVTGVTGAGSPEVDQRSAYLHADTLETMLGTGGPNEVTVVIQMLQDLPAVRRRVEGIAAETEGLVVHSWDERNPALSNLINMAKASRAIFFALIIFLIIVSVANATLMSVLERRREFGVMIALGLKRSDLLKMIMIEVAMLGVVAVAVGAAVTLGIEIFGRTHGFPLAWVGWDPETLEEMNASGVGYDTHFYSRLPPAGAVIIVCGVYFMFLATGLWSALRVRGLEVVRAMREE